MRKLVDHVAVAARCRANPGQWQNVGEYNSTESADGLVRRIRTAYVPLSRARGARTVSPYSPAGAFEAARVLTEFGARVEARYVGAVDNTVTTLTATPQTRRAYLLDRLREYGRPVTTQLAEELMANSPWPTAGRNTLRKTLRGLAKQGDLVPVDTDQGRIYHLTAFAERTAR
ncbi:hypothetical protein [Streptomyces qaidamensis]|uniref:hypothetical protein n=1 Tax=Streptomyces qaidamensis TaxID=1783515 RepID=UPI000A76657D|nr:hypothetical protein [Streptomyces qaidamensis]